MSEKNKACLKHRAGRREGPSPSDGVSRVRKRAAKGEAEHSPERREGNLGFRSGTLTKLGQDEWKMVRI